MNNDLSLPASTDYCVTLDFDKNEDPWLLQPNLLRGDEASMPPGTPAAIDLPQTAVVLALDSCSRT